MISPQELYFTTNKEVPVIDIRPPSEFEDAHIEGSVNIPLYRPITGKAPLRPPAHSFERRCNSGLKQHGRAGLSTRWALLEGSHPALYFQMILPGSVQTEWAMIGC